MGDFSDHFHHRHVETQQLTQRMEERTAQILHSMDERHTAILERVDARTERMDQRADERHRETMEAIWMLRA